MEIQKILLVRTCLSWLQPFGSDPSEEPFWEHDEHDDFLGVGCHMLTPWSISSRATVGTEEHASFTSPLPLSWVKVKSQNQVEPVAVRECCR